LFGCKLLELVHEQMAARRIVIAPGIGKQEVRAGPRPFRQLARGKVPPSAMHRHQTGSSPGAPSGVRSVPPVFTTVSPEAESVDLQRRSVLLLMRGAQNLGFIGNRVPLPVLTRRRRRRCRQFDGAVFQAIGNIGAITAVLIQMEGRSQSSNWMQKPTPSPHEVRRHRRSL